MRTKVEIHLEKNELTNGYFKDIKKGKWQHTSILWAEQLMFKKTEKELMMKAFEFWFDNAFEDFAKRDYIELQTFIRKVPKK